MGSKLKAIIDENLVRTLKQIGDDIHLASGMTLDLDMGLLDVTAEEKVAAAQSVVVAAPGAAAPNGSPRPPQANGPNGHSKPSSSRRRRPR